MRQDRVVADGEQVAELIPVAGDQIVSRPLNVGTHDLPPRPKRELDPPSAVATGIDVLRQQAVGKVAGVRTEFGADQPLRRRFDQPIYSRNSVIEAALTGPPPRVQPEVDQARGFPSH